MDMRAERCYEVEVPFSKTRGLSGCLWFFRQNLVCDGSLERNLVQPKEGHRSIGQAALKSHYFFSHVI